MYYYHIKIFESYLKKFCEILLKYYKNYSEELQNITNGNENQPQNNGKLISLLKCFNVIAPYYKISYIFFNGKFLNISLNLLMNSNLNSEKAELIFELLKYFSENAMCVIDNCDVIINKLFK